MRFSLRAGLIVNQHFILSLSASHLRKQDVEPNGVVIEQKATQNQLTVGFTVRTR
ncbi:MAG: hypothetical protein HQL31_03100 [Planctomycetes bacterium]|nr:hypothetical protein [Planctomycetota bacterium]